MKIDKRKFLYWFLMIMLAISTLFDAITALRGNLAYETNILHLWGVPFWSILVLKFGIMIFLAWYVQYLFKFRLPLTQFMASMLIVYAILLQGLGGASNLYVQDQYTQNPTEVMPPSKAEATNYYLNIHLWLLLIPTMFNLIMFKIYQFLYLDYYNHGRA